MEQSILSQKLAHVRKKHHLSPRNVACLLEISNSTYEYFEKGRRPSAEVIAFLGRLYEVSGDYFLYDEIPVEADKTHPLPAEVTPYLELNRVADE